MSHSGQLTLQLPYVIFGLGATPNFVEKLTVAVPPNKDAVCIQSFYLNYLQIFWLLFFRMN